MELIHESDTKSWIYQKKIKVKDFIDKCINELNLIKEFKIDENNLFDLLKKDLNLDNKSIQKLDLNCSIDKLSTKEEKEFYYFYRNRTVELNKYDKLETLNSRRENLRLFKNQPFHRFKVLDRQKYRTNYTYFNLKENEVGKLPDDRITNFECILTVQLFNPISSTNYKELKHNNFLMHEYHVLGSQKLTVIKDIYQCVSDLISPVDCSKNPDLSRSSNRAEDYTSSCFFINNCFYVDSRQPNNIDYSEVIRKWASDKDRNIGLLTKQTMENTKFEDLEIQLGYPYLYIHQGDCEHLLVFSDLRMHNNKEDFKFYSSFPCCIATVNRNKSRCNLCELNTSKWIVYENQRLPFSPFFFCENCFKCFNYDENGDMIGIFKAYPYIPPNII